MGYRLPLATAGLMLCAASIASADVRQSAGAPPVKTLRGTGSRVLSLSIARTDPIVVTGVFNGQANFIVHLVRGSNTDFVFNEIGAFSARPSSKTARPAATG